MLPRRLIVKNVCQHRHREIEYRYGITGVVGSNGCGKSNLVDTCQYFAISGKTPSGITKGDLLRWGSTTGYTEFVFEHNEVEYTIKRNIHNAKVSLSGEEVDLSGQAASKAMEDMLGMSFDIFYETCWTPQGNLTAILTATHSQRMGFFQKLVDVDRLEKIRSLLQEKYNQLPNLPDRTEEIKQIQERLAELQGNRAGSQEQLDKYTEMYEEFEKHIEVARRVSTTMSETAKQKKVFDQKAVVAENSIAVESFKEAHQIVELSPVDGPSPEIEDLKSRYDRFIQLEVDKGAIESNMEKTDVCALDDDIQEAFDNVQEARSRSDKAQSLLASIEPKYKMMEDSVCPTCSRPMDGAEHLTAEQKQEISDTYKRIQVSVSSCRDELTHATSAYEALVSSKTSQQAIEDSLQERIKQINESIAALGEVDSYDPDEYNSIKQAHTNYVTALSNQQALTSELRKLETQLTAEETTLKHLEEQKAESEDSINQASTFIEKYNELTSGINTTKASLAVVDKEISMQTENLKRFQLEQTQLQSTASVHKTLERCRDVLHKDQLPKLVMRKMLEGLNNLLSSYLGLFDTNFTAYIDEEFDFMCNFPSKSDVPAKMLSGGQKVALAIAFRFALSDLLSTSIPMLTMDEPTVFLDDINIKKVADVLEKAKQTAEHGIVLTVATHEPALSAAFSRTLDISKEYEDGTD
jgi:DNA repair exonuclease SbcCD ATPase subunit